MRFHPMYHQMRAMYAQQQKKHPPSDFSPSFDFGDNFEPRAAQYHSNHVQRDDDSLSARSLSPNNPFSPTFPGREQESPSPVVAPPRPPARIDQRRMSNDSDPPPLPKRKPLMMTGPYYQYTPGHYATAAGMMSRQNYMTSYSPPVAMDAPPLPLPSRKKTASFSAVKTNQQQPSGPSVERRVSFEAKQVLRPIPAEDPFDPFNVTYVERQLSQLPSSKKRDNSSSTSLLDLTTMEKKAFPDQSKISTPLNSTIDPHIIQPRPGDLNFSTISSESANPMNVSQASDTVFEVTKESSEMEIEGYSRLEEKHQNQSGKEANGVTNVSSSIPFNHFGEDHVSPPERNIFQSKDPFADDDFFSAA